MKIRYYLPILLLLLPCLSYAQSGKLFTVDKELSSSLINQIIQDRNGIIWIATDDGLNRYDGSKFTIFKQEDKVPNTLLHNIVRTIYEDSKGRLFLGFFNGLQFYDDATDTFREIPLFMENGQKFNAHVFSILERKNGDIVVGTSGHNLFFLEYEGDSIFARRNRSLVPSDMVNYLYEDREENLWISTQDKGLFRLNKNNELKSFSTSSGIPCNSVRSIVEDMKGNLYVGSVDKGLFTWDKDRDRFVPIPSPFNSSLPVTTFYLSRDSTIYIGTEGKGLLIFNPTTNVITASTFIESTIDLSKTKIHSILEDKAGNIWSGIYQKGVLLLPNNPNNFKYIGHKSIQNNLIGSSSIISVYKDRLGTLWVGTDGDGIYGIGPDGNQNVHFEYTGQPNTVPATIFSIYEDSNHDFWIGSYFNGLAKLDRKTGECVFVDNLLDRYSNPVQRVYSLTEDKDNNLWIGTMGAGLFKMELKSKKITHFDAVDGDNYRWDANFLHNAWVDCILLSSKDKLFVGTYDGLACYDLKTNSFVTTFGINRLLAGNIVYSLYEDEKGTIWVGTSKGLYFLEDDYKEARSFTMEDGLPSNVISAIKGDKNNNLWISTNYGISRFDSGKHTFFNFYSGDGLQGNEFSKDAAFVDSEGKIFFGGINGVTYFNPNDISVAGKDLDIWITDFYIHDKAVKKGMKSGSRQIIETNVREANTFQLSHKDNSFSVEFSAMEFNNPERITYMYSMDNGHWITLRPGTNIVTFNDLSPGEYNFKVRAKDYNTVSDAKEISIVIYPPWYFSTWAKLAYLLVLASIALLIAQLLINRYRTRKKMQEHIHSKQINEAKLQFFINIAHEIRTPMTLIISPLKKLMSKNHESQHQLAYQTMYRNSERILLLINQLMDIRKIDKGQMVLKFQEVEMVAFIKDVYSIFDEQTYSRKVDLKFSHEVDRLNAWIDPENFDKVILNILANALKFTPEHGKIEIHLKLGKEVKQGSELKQNFEIMISDDGIGIQEKDLERIFECFYQTRTSYSNFSEGTGIGLHLTRSIVQLHHGSIKAENNANGRGCRFIISMPLGNSHLMPDEIITDPVMIRQPNQSIHTAISENAVDMKIKSKSKYKVLVVDDDDEIRKYVCRELTSEYHMIDCSNGKEALSLILSDPPDLIISDIMMPQMDGITLCQKVKHNVNVNHVPIILLTARSAEEDNLEGIDIGADAYITKPFNVEILSKTVRNIIKNREMLRNNYSGNQQQQDKVKNVILKSADEKLMQRIMDIINENMKNTAFNVEMLANEIGISRVHLHRKTKELTNQSTRDLIRNIRLQQAANLLSSKNLNISEVAFAVGFTNLATFSSAFKEFFGVPPTTFMGEHLKAQEKVQDKYM